MANFSVNIGAYRFQPSVLTTVVIMVLCPLLVMLGFWQLDRGAQKKNIMYDFEQKQKAKPIALDELIDHPNLQYYSIEIKGKFDNSKQFLLDNRSYQHRIGYEVITPFIPESGKPAILINRGWIAQGPNRQQLPSLEPIHGNVTIQGMVYQPSKAFVLSNKAEQHHGWPHVIQRLDFTSMANELDYNLAPFTIMLDNKYPFSHPRDWKPAVTSPSKHYGYALQWFSFAAISIIIYLCINTIKRSE